MVQHRQLRCKLPLRLPFLSLLTLNNQVMATKELICKPSTREVEEEGEAGVPMAQDHLPRGEVEEVAVERVEARAVGSGTPSTAANARVKESLPLCSRLTGLQIALPWQVCPLRTKPILFRGSSPP